MGDDSNTELRRMLTFEGKKLTFGDKKDELNMVFDLEMTLTKVGDHVAALSNAAYV